VQMNKHGVSEGRYGATPSCSRVQNGRNRKWSGGKHAQADARREVQKPARALGSSNPLTPEQLSDADEPHHFSDRPHDVQEPSCHYLKEPPSSVLPYPLRGYI